VEFANHIVGLYGIPELLTDIDRGRDYSGAGGLAGDTLDWIAGAGFRDFFAQFDFPYHTAQEFRQRYLTHAARGMAAVR
jgi:hypothetical protein